MIIGITGAFGCGKSAVLRFFSSRSWHTFDADCVCKSFYGSNNEQLCAALKNIFGGEIFTADGNIDRAALAKRVFNDPEKMKELTDVVYPLLTAQMEKEIRRCRENSIDGAFELPLLFEADFAGYFDAVLSVWAPAELRRKRLYGRKFSDAEIDRRNRMQMSADEKLERADFAVINTGSLDDLEKQLTVLLKNLH